MKIIKIVALLSFLVGLSVSFAQRGRFTDDSDFPLKVASQDFNVPFGISYQPDQTIEIDLSLENKSGALVDVSKGRWKVVRSRETFSAPDNIWDSAYINYETLVEGRLKGGSSLLKNKKLVELSVRFTPGKYGYFAVLFQLNPESEWERLVGVAIVREPAQGKRIDTPFMGELREYSFKESEVNMDIAGRLGIKSVRTHLYPEIDRERGVYDFSESDKVAEAARRSDVLVFGPLMSSHHARRNFEMPLIGGKPIAYMGGRKASYVVPPAQLEPVGEFGTWADFVYHTVKRYGDCYLGAVVRNEPWEGTGISNWGASGPYLRELHRIAHQAAKKADPRFLLTGNDSRTNFEDNVLMSEGNSQYYDVITSHNYGQSFKDTSAPALGRQLGKEVWETENWESPHDSYVVAASTLKYARGITKIGPLIRSHATTAKNAMGKLVVPSPVGQAVSTWLYFVEDTKPYAELHKEALPWIFLFKSAEKVAPDRHVGIVFGRIKRYGFGYIEGEGDSLFETFHADGKLLVRDRDNALSVFNIEGNEMDFRNAEGAHVIPMTEEPYYIRSSKGIEDLKIKLKASRAHYDEPGIQLALHDLDNSVDELKEVRAMVKNRVLNAETVELRLEAPAGWTFEKDKVELSTLQPGESRELVFKVTQAVENKQNRYPFTLWAKTKQGVNQLSEDLQVTVFQKGSVEVDGDLSDWQNKGAIPVSLGGGKASVSAVDDALFQDQSAADIKGEVSSTFVGMWDEDYFYFAAKVNDDTESIRQSMVSGFTHIMHKDFDYLYWLKPQAPSTLGDVFKVMFDVYRAGEKKGNWLSAENQKLVDERFVHLSVDYEYDFYLAHATELAKPYEQVVEEHLKLVKEGKGDYGRRRPAWPPFEAPTFNNIGEAFPEAWRLMAPGVPRHTYYPFSDRLERDQGIVPQAKLVVHRLENSIVYEGAIPWSELAEVPHEKGDKVRFNWAVLNNGKYALQWARGRSVTWGKEQIAHPTWALIDAVETQWTFRE